MIVYRNHINTIGTIQKIFSLEKAINSIITNGSDLYGQAINILIEAGELETAITDFYCPDKDLINNQILICRNISLCAGSVVYSLWKKDTLLKDKVSEIKEYIAILKSQYLPKQLKTGVPEGFVYYGLYPETYLEAAQIFFEQIKPEKIIVIGLRSIGVQLSALVAASFENYPCSVETFTVRPKGHPFHRHLSLDNQIKHKIISNRNSFIIIVDEGPGLSGSSIGGSIQEIRGLGIAPEKIVIFPSWLPDSKTFFSHKATIMWNGCKKYIGSFEKQWILNGRLEGVLESKITCNISSGLWRRKIYTDETEYPAVHPYHERRKYLLVSKYYKKHYKWIAKFVGLGRYGQLNVLRADNLSDYGFCPPIHKLASGFAIMEFVDGKPLNCNDVNETLIKFVKKYLNHIHKSMSASQPVTYHQLIEMILCNIKEGLGKNWCKHAEKIVKFPQSLYDESTVSIDGRMMPHDFLKTEKGILKVDHIEHNSDQFFHGSQNIAWDVAGFCVEFNLKRKNRDEFLELFESIDPQISKRFTLFNIAYLAFRLGYVSLAAESLTGESDGIRFEKLKTFYSELLKPELLRL